jgi:phospholipase/lecithinase/hemolysin
MPPLGSSPMIQDPIEKFLATEMSKNYNAAVQDILSIYSGLMDIKTLDVFEFFTEAIDEPLDFGFTNTTETCVTPDVTKGAFCKKRNTYLFWDALHPTKTANALLAERALETLADPD